MHTISFIAGLSFIIFGLWTIRGDKLEGDSRKKSRFGPVLTVGIAFFIAEMGDKTQLATISLAIQYRDAINVLLGATLGMVIADALGIVVGLVLRKHIPQNLMKIISASIFILFGFFSVYKVMYSRFEPIGIVLALSLLAVGTALGVKFVLKKL
jgi:putative Ca2+/H+ antiporter (TMEM165/GDT1 family)